MHQYVFIISNLTQQWRKNVKHGIDACVYTMAHYYSLTYCNIWHFLKQQGELGHDYFY